MATRVLIFSHESDLDGLYSAAIGLLRYPQAMTVFLGYGAENFQKLGNFVHSATQYSKDRGLIIIADLGLNDDIIEICRQIFADAVRNGWKLIWVDHHPWSEKAQSAVRDYAELVLDSSGDKCAADLMHDRFMPGNEVAQKLASMAHTMDFFTKDQYLTPISELIRYYQTFPDFYERLTSLAHKSTEGVLWDIQMQSDYNEYSQLRDRACSEVFATMQQKRIAGLDVAFVQSSPFLQNSLFSEEVFARSGADLVIFYSTKGKVSIRRSNEKVSCRAVAENLPDGGGHAYAAGGTFRSDPANIPAVIAELEAAVVKAAASSGGQ